MSSEEPSVILFPEQCWGCGQPLLGRRGRCCSRWCRMVMADFEELNTLRFILLISRWSGAAAQEEARRDYLRRRMRAAVRRLPHDENLLAELLVEIAELLGSVCKSSI